MKKLLSIKDIEDELTKFNEWRYDNNKIKRELKFESYMDSIDFINSVSKKAEQLNHHPSLVVGYCKIMIEFTSHDLGGVTTDCFKMAKYIDLITPD
jgi:4a-hydroxytetrahydrobiopterin dehydratase